MNFGAKIVILFELSCFYAKIMNFTPKIMVFTPWLHNFVVILYHN